ncbi:MAG: tetratricopeptide repeat protein [bacterium]
MKKIAIALTILIASFLFIIACGKIDVPKEWSQEQWTEEGWRLWKLGEYEDAEDAFNSAIEKDDTYSDAYNGLGWTYLKMQMLSSSIDNFNTVKMLESGTIVAYQALVGAAVSFFYTDDFENSISSAREVVDNDPNNEFVFSRDESITAFDIHLLLAMNYFETIDMANCIKEINVMRKIVGETEDFTSNNWDDINKEIKRLAEKDPSK